MRFNDAAQNLSAVLMRRPETWEAVSAIVTSDMLPDGPCRDVLTAFERMAKNADVSSASLLREIRSQDTLEAMARFDDVCPSFSTESAEVYATAVREHYIAGKMANRMSELANGLLLENADLTDTMAELRDALDNAEGLTDSTDDTKDIAACYADYLTSLKNPTRYIKTAFSEFDMKAAGFAYGDLDVISARSGCGKSDFAIYLAVKLAKAGRRVLYLSLEMDRDEITERILSSESGVASARSRDRNLRPQDMADLCDAGGRTESIPLLISAPPWANCNLVEKRIMQHKPEMVFVDNLDLLRPPRQMKEKRIEVEETCHSLKSMARRLHVCIIALVQLNRTMDGRDGAPQMSDLYGGSAIEHDASLVIALQPTDDSTPGYESVTLHILKARNGVKDKIGFWTNPKIHTWGEFDYTHE